jgi:serine/threonine-protein kinase
LFLADNDVASLHRVLSGQITRPRKLVPSLPTSLEDIIMTTVAQDPAGRFATARELADALETFAAIQGLVVGSRWLARTVEAAVGARSAPWIAATTVVAQPEQEASLVAVIELDVEPEPELLPTFGPADGGAEEDALPSASVAALAPRPSRGRWIPYAIAGALVGVGLGAVIAMHGDDVPAPAAAPPARSEPAIRPATPQPPAAVTPPPAPPPAEVEAEDLSAAPAPTGSGSPSRPASRAHRHHLTNPPPAASNAVAGQPAPDPTPPATAAAPPANGSATGSAARPANVEWKPTMLLPTDKGSGTTKSP